MGPDATGSDATRPLSARSVIASVLLGSYPPRLPGRLLVRTGEVFGISEGTTRVALSRMVTAGELEVTDGAYHLAGRLLERQGRQTASRRAEHRRWAGDWELAVVTVEGRDPASRAALRTAMHQLKLAELREGCWARPDNLDPARSPEAAAQVAEQCDRFTARPAGLTDDRALVTVLWDLDAWAQDAQAHRRVMARTRPDLEAGSTAALAPAFVESAAVLRHLVADPELPPALLPADWPGPALRAEYDAFDAAFKTTFRDWFREQR